MSGQPAGHFKPMDLRSISGNQITIWLALAVGLCVALVIGSAVGSADSRFVGSVLAVIPVAVIFTKLKTNIWVLLPIGWYLGGTLPWLGLPLSVTNLCFLAVIASFTLFLAMRVFPWKRKLITIDYLIYINLAYLATVYVRNPAGVYRLQSDIVGGKPYMEIALAFGAYLILSRVQISDAIAKIFPLFFVVPTWGAGLLDAIGRVNPTIGYTLNSLYSAVGTSGTFGAMEAGVEIGTTRIAGLQNAGVIMILAACARYNPSTLISPLYPLRMIMMAIGFGAIFLSGYRGALLFAFVAFTLSVIFRRQPKDLLVVGGTGLLALIILLFIHGNVLQLPLTMQRALSWLPGDWDQEAVMDAEGSTQWRIEMWGWAWNDERIMRDRVWGQGFGFTIDDMNLIANSLVAGGSGSSLLGGSDREQFMVTGTFHSGPLSSIKFIGVVGLALYYSLICYMAVLAWRLCKHAQGTTAFTLALFVGIPIIYEPFNFVVIFGALDISYPQTLFWAGLLIMTQRHVNSFKPPMPANHQESFQGLSKTTSELQPVLRLQPLRR